MSNIINLRSKQQNVRFLPYDKRRKMHGRIRQADIAILGCRQTGRKTLARRFGAMNEGPFEEEVESLYFYSAHVDLDARDIDGTGDVFLTIYVFPPPSDLPQQNLFCFAREIFNFTAWIFLCNVTERATLEMIVELLSHFNIHGLPYFLIVGNKKDLDRENFPQHFTFNQACFETANLGIYCECSAKQNIDVNPILQGILQQIIFEQPE